MVTPAKEPAANLDAETSETAAGEPIAEATTQPKEPTEGSATGPVKPPAKNPAPDLTAKPEGTAEAATTAKPPAASAAPGVEVRKPLPKELLGEAASETVAKTPLNSGAEPPAKPVALPPEPLGQLMSNDQVLLIDDPTSGWTRVAGDQMLLPQRLLVLPTYRAKVKLSVGVTLEILGGSQVELLASSPRELPGIRVVYGRVVMMPLARAGSALRVVFGDCAGVVRFPDAESVAALDVRRVRLPGSNPEAGPPHIVANLFAASGGVVWNEIGGEAAKSLQLTAPEWVSFNGLLTSTPAVSRELPKWIVAEPITPWTDEPPRHLRRRCRPIARRGWVCWN